MTELTAISSDLLIYGIAPFLNWNDTERLIGTGKELFRFRKQMRTVILHVLLNSLELSSRGKIIPTLQTFSDKIFSPRHDVTFRRKAMDILLQRADSAKCTKRWMRWAETSLGVIQVDVQAHPRLETFTCTLCSFVLLPQDMADITTWTCTYCTENFSPVGLPLVRNNNKKRRMNIIMQSSS
jgi:hypothetical protein